MYSPRLRCDVANSRPSIGATRTFVSHVEAARGAVAVSRIARWKEQCVKFLMQRAIDALAARGSHLQIRQADQQLDFRYTDPFLRAAGDTEVALGQFASGIKVGLGARLLQLLSLFTRKRQARRHQGRCWWRPSMPTQLFHCRGALKQGSFVLCDHTSRGLTEDWSTPQ